MPNLVCEFGNKVQQSSQLFILVQDHHTMTVMVIMPLLVFVLLVPAGLNIHTFAESDTVLSPYKQLKQGVLLQEIQCNDEKTLLQKNNRPACVYASTADKLEARGWSVVVPAIKFEPVEAKPETDISINQREEYLSSLSFGLVSDGEFTGELYGFDQNIHLRQPAPGPMFHTLVGSYYSFNETALSGRVNLNDIIPLPTSGGATGASGSSASGNSPESSDPWFHTQATGASGSSASGNGILFFQVPLPTWQQGASGSSASGNGTSGAIIDYREWLPAWIAPGYYLKWIHIIQPEQQASNLDEGVGEIVFIYMPKGLEVSEDITNKEFVDINYYAVSVIITEPPYELYMHSEERINEITRNGTATDIIFEDRWDGYVKYLHASRSDPAKHGVSYSAPYIDLGSGGNALTMQEHENTVTELFERYSNR